VNHAPLFLHFISIVWSGYTCNVSLTHPTVYTSCPEQPNPTQVRRIHVTETNRMHQTYLAIMRGRWVLCCRNTEDSHSGGVSFYLFVYLSVESPGNHTQPAIHRALVPVVSVSILFFYVSFPWSMATTPSCIATAAVAACSETDDRRCSSCCWFPFSLPTLCQPPSRPPASSSSHCSEDGLSGDSGSLWIFQKRARRGPLKVMELCVLCARPSGYRIHLQLSSISTSATDIGTSLYAPSSTDRHGVQNVPAFQEAGVCDG
jgi:hypothetical protein